MTRHTQRSDAPAAPGVFDAAGAGMRKTGIDVVGDAPWGTHFCQFYATKDDLRDILVPYFKAGLEADEFCMWVTSPPLGVEDAWNALAQAVPDLDSYRRRGRIEILPHTGWYLLGGSFEQDRVLAGWVAKLEDALARGCAGLRLTGNTFWLEKSDWTSFAEYEAAVDGVLGQYRMLALCTYALDRCGASEVADVIRNHQFALIKRDGRWELFESFDRRRMQEALRASEARNRLLFQNMLDGFAYCRVLCDGLGRPEDIVCLDVNDAFGRLTGLHDVVGKRASEVIPGIWESHPELLEIGGRVARTGQPEKFEVDFRPLGIWLSVSAYSPHPDHVVAVFDNVTERKRAEQLLCESEEKYRTLFTSVTEGFTLNRALYDETGKLVDFLVLDANPAAERFNGLERKDFVGKTWRELWPGAEQYWWKICNDVMLEGSDVRYENYAQVHDRWYEVHQFRVAKELMGSIFTDVTDRRRAEERTRRQNATLAGIARILREALTCETEEDLGRVCLSVAEEVTQSKFAFIGEINGRTGKLDDLAISDPGWDACRMQEPSGHGKRVPIGFEIHGLYGRVLLDGKGFFTNDPASHPDSIGTPAGHPPLEAFLGVPLLHAKKTIGMIGLGNREGGYGPEELEAAAALAAAIVQAFLRKRAEEEARTTNAQLTLAHRHKDEFLGMLSHELRNPLAPIRNSIYILDHAEPTGEQARRAKEVIKRQAEHLTRLVDDLLDVTRIARGKIELKRTRIDLAVLVRRAGEDHGTLMRQSGIELTVDVPREPMWADGDATRLAQVVGNLLHNSAKFTGRGGRVTLALEAVRGAAEIHVRDTGAGMKPDLLMRVFEPFVQGERTLARTEGGLGLGLALVRGITELHGGSVRAASAGAGQGAEFVVRLPLVEAGTPVGAALPRARRTDASRRVLVVDDNQDAAETLAQLVEMFGHSAEVAYDGPSAIAKARANPPDVIFCDIGLPDMSGYEVVRALRSDEALRLTQMFAVSGYAQPEDRKRAVEAGFDGHVSKPTDPDVIERLLA